MDAYRFSSAYGIARYNEPIVCLKAIESEVVDVLALIDPLHSWVPVRTGEMKPIAFIFEGGLDLHPGKLRRTYFVDYYIIW